MKIFKTIAQGTIFSAATIAFSFSAIAADSGFTSHHLVEEKPYENYVKNLPTERKMGVREYLDYESREPCQFYQPIPEGFIKDGCDIKQDKPERQAKAPVKQKYSATLNDYEVHFAFDSANIEPAAGNTLDLVAREIKKYNPREVTVTGHTDTAGPSEYNEKLSDRRAEAVSDALNNRGVKNRIIDEKAHGEQHLAVNTGNGVPLHENRRVVVEFRK